MASTWMRRDGGESLEEGLEIKPEHIQKAIKPDLDQLKADFSTDIDSKLSPVLEFIKQQKEDRESLIARQQQQNRREQQEDLEIRPEDFIVDPKGAMERSLKPLQDTIAAQSAIIVRDKTLGKMDYYSSDPQFAAKVDALIDSQPLALRSNSAIIMNAYKSVFFDLRKDIEDGKIKSQASLTNFSSNGTGSHFGNGKNESDVDLSPEEKHYAQKMGISEEAWKKSKRELEYV
jgi:hypothetical protein